jgi:hypothetical protein
MAITVSGVIHGRRIDLEQEASLPDGSAVIVRIEPRGLSLQERRNLVLATAGSWRADSSLDRIFEEIAGARQHDSERAVMCDDPA